MDDERHEKKQPRFIYGKYTPAQGELTNKYLKENYDKLDIRVRKGIKDEIKLAANATNMSLNAFCVNAILKSVDETLNDTPDDISDSTSEN